MKRADFLKKALMTAAAGLTVPTVFAETKSGSAHEMKFYIQRHLPMIKLSINGKLARFLVDTGASQSVIDISAKRAYKFKTIENRGSNFHGVGGSTGGYSLQNLELKYEDEVVNVNLMGTDLSNIRYQLGVIGVIGSDYLIANKLVVDFSTLTIHS